jgi:ectoine hydroxylase-related dioxygenase (phytanoyl-CoA dioxygenase family)
LYVVFVAVQDVTATMGPTTFLLGTNTLEARKAYECDLDSLVANAEIRETTMKAGDLVVFDARTMHCGNANLGDEDGIAAPDRALFNFSFRNPAVMGNLGYKGSSRPRYTAQGIRLGHILQVVDGRKEHENLKGEPKLPPPFARYGNGLE